MKIENVKVGDKLYWYNTTGHRVVHKVLGIEDNNILTVSGKIHVKAFVGKLVPKKRLELWVNIEKNGGLFMYSSLELAKKYSRTVHMVEKRTKK